MAKKWTAQIIIETTGITQDEAKSNLEEALEHIDLYDMKKGVTYEQEYSQYNMSGPTTVKKTSTLVVRKDKGKWQRN